MLIAVEADIKMKSMQSNACRNSLRALLFLSFLFYSIFHQDLHFCQDAFQVVYLN